MAIDLSSFRGAFLDEAREHITNLEQGLLSLEQEPERLDSVHALFRAAHSIKGAAGTLGFTDIAVFTHQMETALDAMRLGKLRIDSSKVTALLAATDELRRLVEALAVEENLVGHCPLLTQLIAELRQSIAAGQPIASKSPVAPIATRKLRLRLSPTRRFFALGLDPMLLFSDLERLGTLERVTCDWSKVPLVSELDPTECHVSWVIEIVTSATDAAIEDVFLFVADDCALTLEDLTVAVLAPPPASREETAATPVSRDSSTLRVSSDKVDAIIDLVGELVIAQSIVIQLLAKTQAAKSTTLRDAADSMTRNMQELQERVMGIRMVPIATLFGRFGRVVRDTAAKLNKSVSLELEGQDTEIDKVVAERLVDPLTHLVRNALDHGLETISERAAIGKEEPARIRLSGRHVAGGVVIEVTDNGRGLDTHAIRAKAERQGLISPNAQLTDEQVHALIFEPGFSTAARVSDLSGRGVGMDVVRRCVDGLNGTIALSTALGQGTTVRIRLPLTLAILDGLLLQVRGSIYVLPLLAVVESFRPSEESVKQVTGSGQVAIVRGEAMPLMDLGVELGIATEPRPPTSALVVVVEADGRHLGLVVDSMIGQSQVVVKSVETHYRHVDGVLGATILGDGTVAFILDVSGLARMTLTKHPGRSATRAA